MKSAAFNLAFKVHRNEMPFAEGLLKSVEEDAQHDFIEALNSLAGEMRYDAGSLDTLIEEAQQSLAPQQKPKYDIKALQDELNELKKNRNELKESILSLEGRINALKPTIIPGINAAFIGIVGLMMVLIFFLLHWNVLSIIAFIGILISCVATVIHDMGLLRKQQADIAQKKLRFMNQIGETKEQIDQLDNTIKEKKEFIQQVQNESSGGPSIPTPSAPDPAPEL